MACGNNLKQIGLAAHHYQSDHGRLPPGVLGPSNPVRVFQLPSGDDAFWRPVLASPAVGVFPYLLPYLEQDTIYQRFQIDWEPKPTTTNWWRNAQNWTMAGSRLKVFHCPSDDLYGAATARTVVNHLNIRLSNGGVGQIVASYGPEIGNWLGRTNYLAVSGGWGGVEHPFWQRWDGLLLNRSMTSLATVPDGTSRTLLFGEGLGHMPAGAERSHVWSWLGIGPGVTVPGLDGPRSAYGAGFASRHAAVVQFCLADGSVHALRRGQTYWNGFGPIPTATDWQVLQQLAGRQDGGTADTSAILD
jgi:hypothetical protein